MTPYAQAEIIVTDYTTILNKTMSLNENITILSGGALTILNSTINFNCTSPSEYGITVKSQGTLMISDLDGNDMTEDDASHLSGIKPFFFIVEDRAVIQINNSFISSCGESLSYQFPIMAPCGLIVRTDQFSFRGTVFADSYNGIYLDDTNGGLIENCQFMNLVFGIKSNLAYNYSVRNCNFKYLYWGLHAVSARIGAPYLPIPGRIDIERCTFNDLEADAILVEYPRNISVSECTFQRLARSAISYIGVNPETAQPFDAKSTIYRNSFEDVLISVVLENIQDIEIKQCNFTDFGTAVYLQKRLANAVMIDGSRFSYGVTGINFQVMTASEISINNSNFRKMNIGIEAGNSNAKVSNNFFESVNVAGILHQGAGRLEVVGNSFFNNTYGIKAERDILSRPALFLEENRFEANHVGLSARDIPLTIGRNAWVGNEISILLLGMEVSIQWQTMLRDSAIGIKSISSHCIIENLTFFNNRIGIMADLNTDANLNECTFQYCGLDVVASNSSLVTMVDSNHSNSFDVRDDCSIIRVYWTSTIHLFYLSNGRVAENIPCMMMSSDDSHFGKFTSDEAGNIGPIRILQMSWSVSGPLYLLPYDVIIVYRSKEHPFHVRFETEHWFTLGLDDVPPSLSLFNLSENMKINTNRIQFRIYVHDNESLVETLTVSVDGYVAREDLFPMGTVEVSLELIGGSHSMEISATDDWMNINKMGLNISIDTESPRIFIASPPNRMLTNRYFIFINGTIDGADDLFIEDEKIKIATNGSFSSEVALSKEGSNVIRIKAFDDYNNSFETILQIIRDTIPPSLEIQELPELTNRTIIEIRGTTDGSRISISPPGIEVPAESQFHFNVTLKEGSNKFVIMASDAAGNNATIIISIISDRRIIFELNDPLNGATVEEDRVIVNGLGERGLKVRLISDDRSADWVVVGKNGSFKTILMVPSYGQNIYEFEVNDPAGNSGLYIYTLNKARTTAEPGRDGYYPVPLITLLAIAVIGLMYYISKKSRKGPT